MKFLLPLLLVLTVSLVCYSFLKKSPVQAAPAASKPMAQKSNRPNIQQALDQLTPAPQPPASVKLTASVQRHDLQSATQISQADLEIRAAKVEQEANHELARLVKLLDLSEEQQDKVFAALAQNSPNYHPSMGLAAADLKPIQNTPTVSEFSLPMSFAANGNAFESVGNAAAAVSGNSKPSTNATTGPTAISNTKVSAPTNPVSTTPPSVISAPVVTTTNTLENLLAPYLTTDQKSTLSEEETDRIAWWTELSDNLASGLTTPAVTGSTETAPPETITTNYDDTL